MSYGARKEVTFCLGAIFKGWNDGHFDPDTNPHTGRLLYTVPDGMELDEHCPFWIVPTKDLHDLIFTQAARLMLPLDHFFQEASLSRAADEESGQCNSAESFVRRLFSLYTAQLFCRLLVYNFSNEREFSFDKWIWHSSWKAEKKPGVFVERRGLGLDGLLDMSGMLWLSKDLVDWRRGHIALAKLIDLYIPRSPLQARLTSQRNI